jgi:hypothetical protein
MALAEELEDLGLKTAVFTRHAHQNNPCIRVDSGNERRVSIVEYIYLVNDDGVWWYYWGESLEPIAPAVLVSTAADIIAAEICVEMRRLQPVRSV